MKDELISVVREFISLLDKVEISDEEREFRPNYIGSCRVLDGQRLGKLLIQMKELTNENTSS